MPAEFELLRSLTKDEQTPIETVVNGQIPMWLNGTLFRNGPGRYEYDDKAYIHLFDGHACVHKYKIEDGKVIYSNKFLETESYKKSLKEKRLYPVFGTADVCSNVFDRLKCFFVFPETFDNVNVNIQPFGADQLYALTETNYMCKVDPKTLEITNRVDISKYLNTSTTTFAHPHIESDGSWITMGMNTKTPIGHYDFVKYRCNKDNESNQSKLICEKTSLIASIPSNHTLGLSYFHSFGVTQNFIVFIEQSLILDFPSFISCVVLNKPFSDALLMCKTFNAHIHLINRHTCQIYKQKFITEPLVLFHHINAYEIRTYENILSRIVVDFCGYDVNIFDINKFTYAQMFTDKQLAENMIATARRILIPMDVGFSNEPIKCEIVELSAEYPFELPSINYSRFNGKPYKFVYGLNLYKRPFSVIKMNMNNPMDVIEIAYGEKGNEDLFLPSEPVFVENPNPSGEDDGVLLVMVLSTKNDFLSILNANDLTEIARAQVPENVKTSHTFHGFFASKHIYPKLN